MGETAESTLRSAILKTNYYFAKRARLKAKRARRARAVQHRSERMERSSSLDDFTSDVMNSISAFKTENSRCSSNNELDTIEETDDDWKEARLTASSPKSLLEVSYEEIDNLLDMSRGIIDSMTGIDQIETNDSGLGSMSETLSEQLHHHHHHQSKSIARSETALELERESRASPDSLKSLNSLDFE